MRRIIIVLLFFVASGGKAQEKEHFSLFTDRDLYPSGETILFKVFIPNTEQSGVIKVDLINIRGKIISGVSRKITNQQADGFLYLPDSLKTGSYLLCTSTRVNPDLTVKELFICNRFSGLSETATILRATDIIPFVEKPADALQIEGISRTCKTRDKAQVTIHLPTELLSKIKDHLLVSVAEVVPEYNSKTFLMKAKPQKSRMIEKEGIVLEGYAKDLKTGAPFQNGCIFLSTPDSIPGIDYFITGEDGYFNFQLKNYYGKIPVVVQGLDTEKKRLMKISLNHSDSLPEGVPAFEIQIVPTDFQKSTGSAIEATTLRKIFNYQELTIDNPPSGKKNSYPFYGVPTEIVYPHLFIDLPDFTEISRELLPGVKFRAFNRIPTMQILNPVTLNYFNDQPLVTLDGIPVHDLNVIKNLGSKEISRIEISRKERFYGDLVFPGVVAIYSTKPDNKRLAESDDLIKLDLDAIQPDASLNTPHDQKLNEPDLRKVLLWNPSLKPEETMKFDFETSDIKGNFKLIVRGKTSDGSIVYKEQIFEVK